MKRERLEVQEGLRRGSVLPYSWLCSLSSVFLGPTPAEVPLEDLLEARFFGPMEEVRIFRRDGVLHAAVCDQQIWGKHVGIVGQHVERLPPYRPRTAQYGYLLLLFHA